MKTNRPRIIVQAILFAFLSLYSLIGLTGCGSSRDQNKNIRQGVELVVLNYHNIGNHDELYSVSSEQFTQQVEYLLNKGYSVISLAGFRAWRQGEIELPHKVFMLTFDDGNLSHYKTVYPFIKKHNLKGVFFLKTKTIDTAGHLTTAQIKEMSSSGLCEFGSHSVSHRNVIGMGNNILTQELTGSRNTLQSITGQDIYAFAYPNGMWDEAAKKALVDNGYQLAFTVMPGLNDRTTDPLELRRITLKRETKQQLFIAWVERDAELYKNYYSAMLQKSGKDGLISVAKVSQEELQK